MYLRLAAQDEAECGDSLYPNGIPADRPRTWADRATVRACALLLLVEVLVIGTFILIQLANLNG
ncbi:hypothetical protein [Novosphingobium sp. FKTRR1]|uniref:hypothetical protein n=1 Tax=Novosphingobium sp. FKTRR1 TaxID=2879118 RepID=UPI001CF08DE2|nr:hypothetical protein [Novosphingobium sp. FKTRR1]